MAGPRVKKGSTRVKKTLREYMLFQKGLAKTDREKKAIAPVYRALKALTDYTEELYTPDKDGNYKELTQVEINKLSALYQAALKEIRPKAAGTAGADIPNATVFTSDMVTHRIYNTLLQDVKVLQELHADSGLSLPEAIARSRNTIINIDPTKFGRMGGNQSSRIPMSIPGAGGKEIRGVFTPTTQYEDTHTWVKHVLEALKPRYPEYTGYIDKLIRNANRRGYVPMSKTHLTQEELAAGNDQLFSAMAGEYSEKVMERSTQIGMYTGEQHLPNGVNIDKRNSAMSTVAELLGRPNLIAKSSSATVKIGDKLITGTFMEAAAGADLNHVQEGDPILDADISSLREIHALKDLADLQVLDFICFNIDRHLGNFFFDFRTDPNTGDVKLHGIKGIDNDCSFGLVSRPRANGENQMCGINNMLVISAEMGTAIQRMSYEELEFTLSDKLEPNEIRAAWDRMQIVKAALTGPKQPGDDNFIDGEVAMITDSEWENLNIASLSRVNNGGHNIFALTEAMFLDPIVAEAPRENPFKQTTVEQGKEQRRDFVKDAQTMRQMYETLLENNKGKFIGSSKYRSMLSYAREASEIMESLSESGLSYEAKLNIEEKVMGTMHKYTESYLSMKLKGAGFAKNQRSQKRAFGAQQLNEFTAELMDSLDMSQDEMYRQQCIDETKELHKTLSLKAAGARIKEINAAAQEGKLTEKSAETFKEVEKLVKYIFETEVGVSKSGLQKEDLTATMQTLSRLAPEAQPEAPEPQKVTEVKTDERTLLGDKMFKDPRPIV